MNNKISPIGLYRRDITDPEQLSATTIGRQHLVDDLLDKLKRRGNKKSGQNHLFIGPRGIGKTHLLSLLVYGVVADEVLNSRYTIIRFPEESNRVLSFADLLLGIIELLAEAESDALWQKLHERLETEEDDNFVIDSILPRFKHWHKQSGKTLLILMENMDLLFTQQIKKRQDIHRIRSLLMDNSHIILIGTAPSFFPALNDVKHPLYDFFDIQVIDELSQEQTLALIKAHLEWDQRDDLLQQFDQLKPRLLAMHTLTGGNPRLTMMLYELIVQDNLTEIKTRFHQMLDRITPFYQDRIKELPPQERALLETIALMRTQKRTPVNIARKFRKPRHQTSALLKRMTQAGYLTVSPNPNDKRSRFYRIKEGFFDIWLAMNESRSQRKYLPYLVDFFTLWYASVQEREERRHQLSEQLASPNSKDQKNTLETLAYLSEAAEHKSEQQQAKAALAVEQLKLGYSAEAATSLSEAEESMIREPKGLIGWMKNSALRWSDGEQQVDLIQQMEQIIAYWQEQRSGDLEKAARLFHELSLDFSSHGLHQLHIALLNDRLAETDAPDQKCALLLDIARSEQTDGKLSAALESLEQALEIAKQMSNRKLEGTTLNNISQIYHARGDYETALSYLEQSLAIHQEIGDKSGEGRTLNNISGIYSARGDYETALSCLKQSLAIRQEIGDKSGEGATLNNISQIYQARGDYESALSFLNQSLAIQQEVGNKSGEGTTLNNISQIYHARGDYETALSYLEQSLAIHQEIGDKSGEGRTLNNISLIYSTRGDHESALSVLKQSLVIMQEIGNKSGEGTTLNNMSQIYHARGDHETALSFLKQSLAIRQAVGDELGEGTTLNNISQIYQARGDYETALSHLKQSLAIQQAIGDVAGLCATLFNMGHIHLQNRERDEAMQVWVTVYRLAQPSQMAQILEALEGVAEQLGLEGGLNAWAALAEQMEEEGAVIESPNNL